MHRFLSLAVISSVFIFMVACQGTEGPIGPAGADGDDGLNSLVNVSNEPAGDNCDNGGLKVEIGLDTNGNGSLDADEILSTSYICNGMDGNSSLTEVITESAGLNCANGGVKVNSGVDVDKDGVLSESEISSTAFVCNGVDGNNSLSKITSEEAGVNCETGGIKIETGLDANGNNILDEDEIAATAYACNGLDGELSLVNINEEAAGENCEGGGVRVDSGIDEDEDGLLDEEEIAITRFICNGIDGGFDEQIRLIMLMEGGTGTNSTTGLLMGNLFGFDKRFWNGVDSIVFVPEIYASNEAFSATAELYDVTNNTLISNSSVSTNSTTSTTLFSPNIYDHLPSEMIDLSMQLRTENSSSTAWRSGSAYIFLYR